MLDKPKGESAESGGRKKKISHHQVKQEANRKNGERRKRALLSAHVAFSAASLRAFARETDQKRRRKIQQNPALASKFALVHVFARPSYCKACLAALPPPQSLWEGRRRVEQRQKFVFPSKARKECSVHAQSCTHAICGNASTSSCDKAMVKGPFGKTRTLFPVSS